MFTKNGYYTIGTIAIFVFIFIIIAIFASNSYTKIILTVIPGIFLLFTLYFFRDPHRDIPQGEKLILSPADGKIINISEVEEKNYINARVKKISIFMSPLNVHVNRIPADGEIEYLKYHPGKYLVAYADKSSEINERMEIGLNTESGKILFVQIAGLIARRIVCELKLYQRVEAGEKFGMIKFGSRVDVYLPIGTELLVKENDKVLGGETILARFTEK
ncbi:MAG: phosphatidylserine decarboxylase family protein [Ignavibacteria bacterium]|nr:phosphatidylserine decarboxylase family protein [Ignavibacteria bacterium]